MRRHAAHLLIAAAFAAGTVALGQQKDNPPAFTMGHFQMVFLTKGPAWTDEPSEALKRLQAAHVANIYHLLYSHIAVAAGPLRDSSDILGVLVMEDATADSAAAIMAADPAVRAKRFNVEIHPWFAAKGIMRSPDTTKEFSTYLFGILRKGSGWTAEETDATRKIQEGHMANIRRMASLGKLVHAGPFTDDGDLRGIFIFKGTTVDEARALCENDPAIRSGRLILDLHPWMVPKGCLP